jgi:hypothetical protein
MFKIFRLALVPVVVALVFAAVAPASAKVVGEPKLVAACAKEAAQRTAMDVSDVLTLPAELSKGKYFVNAQISREDGSLMMIECQFDSKKKFKTISIDGQVFKITGSAAAAAPTGQVPDAASASCLDKLAGPATIQQVSPLRPGYFELIIKEKNSGRKVACTVYKDGTIEDWVEMN